MIDSYKFPQLLRSVAPLRAAFILGFVLLFAVPASGQTRIYQFTGPATVEINNVAQAGTPLTRIELKNTNLFTPATAACLARFSVKSVLINRNSSSTESLFLSIT